MESDCLVIQPKMNVSLKDSNQFQFKGSLCFSKHYMMIYHSEIRQNDFSLLLRAIDTVRMINIDSIIEIRTKDFKIYHLEFLDEPLKNVQDLLSSLDFVIKNDTVEESFPFVYKPTFTVIEDGWTAFQLKEEFTEILINGNWKLMSNECCATYDRSVLVPADATAQHMLESARVHAKERFPVLSFCHRASQASLLRCSQYTSSLDRMASVDPLIKALKYPYYFVDIRSKNLIRNVPLEGRLLKSASSPTEKLDSLLASFQRFIEVCQEPPDTPVDRYLDKLEASQWLEVVRQMLRVSRTVAHSMAVSRPLCCYIVVGDSGCDYELVVSSLAQVILVPDARTIRGFEALVDREWVQGGHPFWDRCGRVSPGGGGGGGEAPVFLLFLDCVWQIMQFNPTSFEFTEDLLEILAHHAYFSEFGTFLGNSPHEREALGTARKTTSLWSYVNQNTVLETIMSPAYAPAGRQDQADSLCWPPVLPQALQVWRGLYAGRAAPHRVIRSSVAKETVRRHRDARTANIQLRKILEGLEADLRRIEGAAS